MLKKRYNLNWTIEAPDAILTCSIIKCRTTNESYIAFGGHDKSLYIMDMELNIIDDITFDGWCRCSYAIDLDEDGCDELLVGSGDGSCLVFEFDPETKKLNAIMKYISEGKISCCIAGDFYRNGETQFIFGGEDKTIKIFDGIDSKNPRFILYYDSWVTCCTLGHIKLKSKPEPIYGLLVGTKNGMLQLIQIIKKSGKPFIDILWQRDLKSQINFISVGDVTNDGYNEIVLATDDSYLKILNGDGMNVRYIRVYNDRSVSSSRPLAILIDDIDGDNSKEMIVGCADGSLRVYHNTELNSTYFEQKWKTKVSTSIKDICPIEDFEHEGKKHFIFGGYDRTLRHVTDFYWGKKPFLKIPVKFREPKIEREAGSLKISKEKKFVPTNIREHVIYILIKRRFVATIELLEEKLEKKGYEKDLIKEELELMQKDGILLNAQIDDKVWMLSSYNIDELLAKKTVEIKKIEEDEITEEKKEEIEKIPKEEEKIAPVTERIPEKESPIEEEKEEDLTVLAEKIVQNFKIALNFPKMEENLVNVNEIKARIEQIGLDQTGEESDYEPEYSENSLEENQDKEEPIDREPKEEEEGTKNDIKQAVINLLQKEGSIEVKTDLINAIVSLGFEEQEVEQQIDNLKEINEITYSRSNPKGWRLVPKDESTN